MVTRSGGRLRWVVGALGVLGLTPRIASAHGVTASRFAVPVPLDLLYAGAAAAVVLTALMVAVRDRDVPVTGSSRIVTVPGAVARPLRSALRWGFLAAVVVALVSGVGGRQVAAENAATVFTWAVWVHGLALVSVLLGSPWRLLSPWRTVYGVLTRIEGNSVALLGEYPRSLGSWPALVGFVVLVGVVENLTRVPLSPRGTSAVIATYGLLMVGGAVCYGPTWFSRADPLEVLYRLLGRVAPLEWSRTREDGASVAVRRPWRGCLDPVEDRALVAFAVATVFTVSFDGIAETRSFGAVVVDTRAALGTGDGTSVLLFLAGLLGFVVAFVLVCWLVARLGGGPLQEAPLWFAPTLLPIAAAYEVAHTYPYVLQNVGQLPATVPAGLAPVELLGWLSLPAFWGSQVVLIVLGHVVAVVAAHAVAVQRYETARAALRGHLPLVVLMVGYTVLSLWIVSQPVAG